MGVCLSKPQEDLPSLQTSINVSPSRALSMMDPKTPSLQVDASTQAILSEIEKLVDTRCNYFPESDLEDWNFQQYPPGDLESKGSDEILSALRNHLDKIEAIVRVLLANVPSSNAASVVRQICRVEKPVRNPPFLIHQQVSHESNNMSIDSGVPVDLSPSSPELNLKLHKSNDGRHLKQVLLPNIKSRSLDQSQGVAEAKVNETYRRTLSCPILQNKSNLVARGIQTDVSCVRVAEEDWTFSACHTQNDDVIISSSDVLAASANSLASFDASTPNCPGGGGGGGHVSHKLPMLPEEDHEDLSTSPLTREVATPRRHTTEMFVCLRLAPPPYRDPPPAPPPAPPIPSKGPIESTPEATPTPEDFSETHGVHSCVVEIGETPRAEPPSALHQRAQQNGERERRQPEHLLRRLSSKRRLGFEGSNVVMQRSAAVELDEFESTSVDACDDETPPASVALEAGSPFNRPLMEKPDSNSPSEDQWVIAPTKEPLRRESLKMANLLSRKRKSSLVLENLSEQEVEDEFNRLSLANRLDKSTVGQRLELHQRQRNLAERDVDRELAALKSNLNEVQAKSSTFSDSEVRDSLARIQQRVDGIQAAVARVSGRAEAYGVVQKEKKNCFDFGVVIKYAEIERNRCKQYEKQLEELRKMNQRLSNENVIRQLISSSGGASPKSTFLSSSPALRRRRASVAIDSCRRSTLVETPPPPPLSLCACPKANGELQGALGVSSRSRSDLRIGSFVPICCSSIRSIQAKEPGKNGEKMGSQRLDTTNNGFQDTTLTNEPCVAAVSTEGSLPENTLVTTNEDIVDAFADGQLSSLQSSRIYEYLHSLEEPTDDDDEEEVDNDE